MQPSTIYLNAQQGSTDASASTFNGDEPPSYISALEDGIRTENSRLAASAQHDPTAGRIQIKLEAKAPLSRLPSVDSASGIPFLDHNDGDLPSLSIVILIVGSRGDVQPFIPLALKLKEQGHRVRIGTHGMFERFVKDFGLEFFDIGGDPSDLMSYMVKNPSVLPGVASLTNGDIGRKQKMIGEMLEGCWGACFDPTSSDTFIADAIIANPPSFAHIHCAEALNVPLHITFTMPWVSTSAFPHPLVNISSNADESQTNYLSYGLVDMMTWQGLGGVINDFRQTKLALPPLGMRSGSLILESLKIPTNFCWSPTLIPKPKDWGSHIDVTGFNFVERDSTYEPPADLKAFLAAGKAPVYIGFGSVPLTNSAEMTRIIFSAVKAAKVRALVSAGWAKLGEGVDVPEDVLILGNVPHEWLFQYVKATVHHGGAGTTAIAVREGRPSLIVPFFGDQPFWGEMIARAGAGPDPIHHKKLNIANLTCALRFLVKPETLAAAQALGVRIRDEDGLQGGYDSFYRHLPRSDMRCHLDRSRSAVWFSPEHDLLLSTFAAQVLADQQLININHLVFHRVKEHTTRAEVETVAPSAIARLIDGTTKDFEQMLAREDNNTLTQRLATNAATRSTIDYIHRTSSELDVQNKPRTVGEIRGRKSAWKEVGRGFWSGVKDGVVGVWEEPIKGGKEEGAMGVAKGVAKGIIGLHLKPAAGALGVLELPSLGAWESARRRLAPATAALQAQITSVRQIQGLVAAETATEEERRAILERWYDLTGNEQSSVSLQAERKSIIPPPLPARRSRTEL